MPFMRLSIAGVSPDSSEEMPDTDLPASVVHITDEERDGYSARKDEYRPDPRYFDDDTKEDTVRTYVAYLADTIEGGEDSPDFLDVLGNAMAMDSSEG